MYGSFGAEADNPSGEPLEDDRIKRTHGLRVGAPGADVPSPCEITSAKIFPALPSVSNCGL